MPTGLVLYFAVLGALGFGSIAVTYWLLTRNQGRRSDARRPREKRASGRLPPLVQVILPERGSALIWVVQGRAVERPELVEEPELRAALEEFMARLEGKIPQRSEPAPEPQAVPLPLPGPKEAASAEVADRAEVERRDVASDPPPDEVDPDLPVIEILPYPEEEAPPPRNPLSYDEELERPFLDRVRASFFNRDTPRSPASRLDAAERRVGGTLPRFDALEEIFRERLAMHPEAPPTQIRSGPGGLLEIVVEGRVYEHIDEVPFPAVRETMREAVRIWESRID